DATRDDLAALRNIPLQQLHILVVDLGCIGAREWTGLTTAEEGGARAALWRECHGLFLPSNSVRNVYVVAFVTAAAFAAAASIAPRAAIVAVAVGFAHHRGGTILERVDADREVAEHVLMEAFLALDLVQRCRRRIVIEQGHVRLAVVADAVVEGLQAPIFVLGYFAAHLPDHTGQLG